MCYTPSLQPEKEKLEDVTKGRFYSYVWNDTMKRTVCVQQSGTHILSPVSTNIIFQHLPCARTHTHNPLSIKFKSRRIHIEMPLNCKVIVPRDAKIYETFIFHVWLKNLTVIEISATLAISVLCLKMTNGSLKY